MTRREQREKSNVRKIILIVLAAVLTVLIIAVVAVAVYLNQILHSYQYVPLETHSYEPRPSETDPPTEEPTTEEPTTAEPSTAVPTETETETSSEAESSTEEPTTEEPTTEEPTTEAETEIPIGVGVSFEISPVERQIEGYRNILILGTDARDQKIRTGGANSDVMIIASINERTGEIKLASVLRDCVLLQETGSKRFNKANNEFARTNISNTVAMLNRNLGLDISEFVIINWKSVAQTIDAIGGIEFTIPNEQILDYFNGYLTAVNESTGMWAPQIDAPGTYRMSGTQAVAFCRIRYGGFEEYGRTAHQREAIQKALERVKDMLLAGDLAGVTRAAKIAMSGVASNLTPEQILELAANALYYTVVGDYQFPSKFIHGNALASFHARYGINSCMMPNTMETEVKRLHAFLFNDPYYELNETIRSIHEAMLWELEN